MKLSWNCHGVFSGWWYTYPSEKYESQLGWWNSQYVESHKNSMVPVTTNQLYNVQGLCSVYINTHLRLRRSSILSWLEVAERVLFLAKPSSNGLLKPWELKGIWTFRPIALPFSLFFNVPQRLHWYLKTLLLPIILHLILKVFPVDWSARGNTDRFKGFPWWLYEHPQHVGVRSHRFLNPGSWVYPIVLSHGYIS